MLQKVRAADVQGVSVVFTAFTVAGRHAWRACVPYVNGLPVPARCVLPNSHHPIFIF